MENGEKTYKENVGVRRHIDEMMLKMLAGQKETVEHYISELSKAIVRLTEKIGSLDVACGDRRATLRKDLELKADAIRQEVFEIERKSLKRFNRLLFAIVLAIIPIVLNLAIEVGKKVSFNPVRDAIQTQGGKDGGRSLPDNKTLQGKR